MSRECCDCERDLRLGHAADCPRKPNQCSWTVEESIYPTVMRHCSRKATPGFRYCKQHGRMAKEQQP